MRTINLATCPFAVCSYTTSTPSTSSSSSSPSSRSMPAIRARVTGFHDKSSKDTCAVLRFFDRCKVDERLLCLSDAAAMKNETATLGPVSCVDLFIQLARLQLHLPFTAYSNQLLKGLFVFPSVSKKASTDTTRIAHLLTASYHVIVPRLCRLHHQFSLVSRANACAHPTTTSQRRGSTIR